jgi:hypothetical protein
MCIWPCYRRRYDRRANSTAAVFHLLYENFEEKHFYILIIIIYRIVIIFYYHRCHRAHRQINLRSWCSRLVYLLSRTIWLQYTFTSGIRTRRSQKQLKGGHRWHILLLLGKNCIKTINHSICSCPWTNLPPTSRSIINKHKS